MQICRDNFVASLVSKFPDEFDQDEIYEIMLAFKEPYVRV